MSITNLLPRVVLACCVGLPSVASATHLIGAEINLIFITGDQYEVRLMLWRDCQGLPMATNESVTYGSPCGSGVVSLGLTSSQEVSPLCPGVLANSTCNGGNLPGVERTIYTGLVTLPACATWSFQWEDCCWSNAATLASAAPPMVAHATLNNASITCRSGPRFLEPGLPMMASNDSLSFDLLGVYDGIGIVDYALVDLVDENNTPLPYTAPYSGAQPYPGMAIDPMYGRVEAPAGALVGGYPMSVEIRVNSSLGSAWATTERVFILFTTPAGNAPPRVSSGAIQLTSGTATLINQRRLTLLPGESFCFDAEYADPNGDVVTVTSDILTALPGSSFTTTAGAPATASYCWTAPVGSNGLHRFIATASDANCPLEGRPNYLYTVHVLPDVDPCLSTGLVEASDADASGLSVAPNPTDGTVNWTGTGQPAAAPLLLFDLEGRLLHSYPTSTVSRGTLQLPADLVNGTYVLHQGLAKARIVLVR